MRFLIAVLTLALIAGCGESGQSVPAAADKPAAAAAAPATPPAKVARTPQVLLGLELLGRLRAAALKLELSMENSAVNQLGDKASDVQHYHTGGEFYLEINSECNWHVKVTG